MSGEPAEPVDVAGLLERLRAAGETVAVAESLTGGLVAASLTDVPGASDVFRGGVVAYATDLKAELLGVDPQLLAEAGPVDERVAAAMAEGVRHRLGATWGLATTGVAGPDPQAGHAPGLVYLGVAGPAGTHALRRLFNGDRDAVRRAAVSGVLRLLSDTVGDPRITRRNGD